MKNKFTANKNLGQHFLKDDSVITKICNDSLGAKAVIEIGPGPGVLTERLKEMHENLVVIEKDDRFIPHLAEWITDKNVIHRDAMKIDYEQLIFDKFKGDPVSVVSNLPYNISAPLTVMLMKINQINKMTLMFQKEVGVKFLPTENSRKLSNLSVLTGAFFNTKTLCKVRPGAFHPPPKVESIVITYERLKIPKVPLEQFDEFESFLRKLFQFRRKQLKSNLKGIIDFKRLDGLNIDEKIRAEDLTLDQVLEIYEIRA